MGKAIELAYDNFDKYNNHLIKLREKYISEIEKEIPCAKLNGHRTKRLPGNANFSFKNIDGQSLIIMLDTKKIYASSGSACTSSLLKPSHVLLSIGLDEKMALSSLRTTFGKENTNRDIEYIVYNLKQIINKLKIYEG